MSTDQKMTKGKETGKETSRCEKSLAGSISRYIYLDIYQRKRAIETVDGQGHSKSKNGTAVSLVLAVTGTGW